MHDDLSDRQLEGKIFELLEERAALRLEDLTQLRRISRQSENNLLETACLQGAIDDAQASELARELNLDWAQFQAVKEQIQRSSEATTTPLPTPDPLAQTAPYMPAFSPQHLRPMATPPPLPLSLTPSDITTPPPEPTAHAASALKPVVVHPKRMPPPLPPTPSKGASLLPPVIHHTPAPVAAHKPPPPSLPPVQPMAPSRPLPVQPRENAEQSSFSEPAKPSESAQQMAPAFTPIPKVPQPTSLESPVLQRTPPLHSVAKSSPLAPPLIKRSAPPPLPPARPAKP